MLKGYMSSLSWKPRLVCISAILLLAAGSAQFIHAQQAQNRGQNAAPNAGNQSQTNAAKLELLPVQGNISMVAGAGGNIAVQHWSSASSGPTQLIGWFIGYHAAAYFRIKYDGTTLIYSFSFDCISFQQIYSEAVASAFTTAPNQLGLCVSSASNNGPNTVCSCDWFRRTV